MALVHFFLLLITSAAALVLPQDHDNGVAPRQEPTTVPPPTTTPAPTFTINCDNRYCDGTTSWCFYWGGVTSYDLTLGPVPGETRTALGLCTTSAPVPTLA
jgi:hypothetical protein